jgi:dienelactone hydrolase
MVLLGVVGIAWFGCMAGNTAENANVSAATPVSTGPIFTAQSGIVNIRSADSLVLVGTFLPASRPNSPALLLLHQWQSDRHSFDDFAKEMQTKGFNVLSIDGRGFGESTKKADGSTVSAGRGDADVTAMLGDVNAAIEYLSKQKNVDQNRIGIVGASYGSSLAIIYAADNAKIRSVALLSPGLNYFGNMPTEPAVKNYGNRDLFLAASTEDRESADAVTQLGADAGPPGPALRSSTVVTTGGHGTGLFKADGNVENALEQFLIRSLKG